MTLVYSFFLSHDRKLFSTNKLFRAYIDPHGNWLVHFASLFLHHGRFFVLKFSIFSRASPFF